jgi:hypothetical protein
LTNTQEANMNTFPKIFCARSAKFAAAFAFSAVAMSSAYADGQRIESVMNKTGTYEQTMNVYLHPAHGFPGSANRNGAHPAVLVYKKGNDPMVAYNGLLVGHAATGDSRASAQEDLPALAARQPAALTLGLATQVRHAVVAAAAHGTATAVRR